MSSPWLPYFYFLCIFTSTLFLTAGFGTININSSSFLMACLFVSLVNALIIFIVSAIVYNKDNKNCNYREKIKELY